MGTATLVIGGVLVSSCLNASMGNVPIFFDTHGGTDHT